MSEQKKIVFKEDADREMKPVGDVARQWFEFNQRNVHVKTGVYNTVFNKDTREYRRTAVIVYEGESGPHPQECRHAHTKYEDIPPTCQIEGVRRTTCTDCGKYIGEQNIPVIGHNYTWKDNNDATCTNNGTRIGSCSYCHKTVVETKPNTALGHKYNYISDNNATCIKDGTETAVCSRCGDTKTRVAQGSALGHNMPSMWSVRVAPTCTTSGLEFRKCIRCGYEETRSVSALGHNLPNTWTVRTAATEQASGIEFRKCTRCDYEETRIIPKLEHSWVSNNDGTHTCTTVAGCGVTETCSPNTPNSVCTKCGYHTLPEFRITTETLNSLTVGTSYTQTMTTTQPPAGTTVKWSVFTGNIPGLTLSEVGLLKGTPTTAGTHTLGIKAEYSISGKTISDTKVFNVTVVNPVYTVTFNANGGQCSESTRSVEKGKTIGSLPTPTKEGFEFGGWFTAKEGGLKVDINYNVSSNITLYARWGQGTDIEFGEPTSSFNIKYNGGITNYSNNPYTIYFRRASGASGDSNLVTQVGISSTDGTNNLTNNNKKVVLYLKVTNNGTTGSFDIGFDADSKIGSNDNILVTRISNGLRFGAEYEIQVPYSHTAWVGAYGIRTANRYVNSAINTNSNNVDSGFAFTINNISITSGSYAILEITFQKL